MPFFPSFLRALGAQQAVANAAASVAARRQEDWLVAGLARRLDQRLGGSGPVVRDSVVPVTAAV